MAQGQSTKIMSMMKWIRTGKVSKKKTLCRGSHLNREGLREHLVQPRSREHESVVQRHPTRLVRHEIHLLGGCASGFRGRERDFFIDNLLVRIHFIIEMIRWIGLAPWESEFPFSGSLTSTFL